MLVSNSKKVKPGDTFIALKGETFDGHDFILEAIKNGATSVIASSGKYDVDTIIVPSTQQFLMDYLRIHLPNLTYIGITGTNGKTTTAYLIYEALNMLNIKCAYIGTIGFYIDEKVCDLDNTTPGSIEIFDYINMAHLNGCTHIVMEVSSHALKQGRCDFIPFKYAIFTNLTQDHLDYHKTMEDYKNSKLLLFTKLLKGQSIINNDYNEFKINNYITYGISDSDYNISMDEDSFMLNDEVYKMSLIGKHNVYNMSCTIILLKLLGFNYEEIKKCVLSLKSPKGRLENINYNSNLIIVDYAHTPDAVLNVLETVNNLKHNRIITIIGCGGNRDKTKRPIMGQIATSKSDYVIFTNDNPRNEDEFAIVNDIVNKLDIFNYEIILNREIAIEKGIQMLKNNDILLVLGKGHEEYQIIGNKKRYFSDLEIIKKYTRR